MAGHSQFKNIMYRKGAQDKKRARLFARLGRELVVAAKSGLPDPEAFDLFESCGARPIDDDSSRRVGGRRALSLQPVDPR